jgi:predicted RNA-binding Zn ribbon-like protein
VDTRQIATLQLDGGCLVFDFTNTINSRRSTSAYEYLNQYQDLLAWAVKVGMIMDDERALLALEAEENAERAEGEYLRVMRTREVLYALFSMIAAGSAPDKAVVEAFNTELSGALRSVQLTIGKHIATVQFRSDQSSLGKPLNAILKSAYDVLMTESFTRMKECPSCGWLFLDKTKNGKRRWCNMDVCGSKDKAKRYYQRKKIS